MNINENRKVKNASPKVYNNIHFKSLLETMIYKTLCQAGFNPEYEKVTFTLWKGYRPTVPFYNKDKATRMLKLDMKKLIDITYTPDFTFYHNGHLIIIEAKGMENDVFPIKKKLFRKLLEEQATPCIYFEIYSKKQCLQAIEIIKNLKK